MCNRIGNFINLLMSCVMALVVSVSVAGAAELTPDTGIDTDTPVDKVDPMRNCLCDNGDSRTCLTGQVCDPVACVCSGVVLPDPEPVYECLEDSDCVDGAWSKCSSGDIYYRTLYGCVNNKCRNVGTGYSCPTGTYGSPTSCSGVCVVCPTNATCFRGSNETYTCAKDYYVAEDSFGRIACLKCPDEATCSTDINGIVQCNQDYYRQPTQVEASASGSVFSAWFNWYVCVKCPNEAKTKGVGATNKTECYLPENTSETETYEDSYGKFEVSGDCFWTQ